MHLVGTEAICEVEVQEVLDCLEASLKCIGANVRQPLGNMCACILAVLE